MNGLFSPVGNTQRLDITTTQERFALAGLGLMIGGTARLYVDGTDLVFIAFGDSTVAAAVPADNAGATGMPIGAGRETGVTIPGGATHLSVICASGSAKVYVTAGAGI